MSEEGPKALLWEVFPLFVCRGKNIIGVDLRYDYRNFTVYDFANFAKTLKCIHYTV